MDFARNLRGFCVGFARNLILFLFEREHEGYKRFADCTVPVYHVSRLCYSTFRFMHPILFCSSYCSANFDFEFF